MIKKTYPLLIASLTACGVWAAAQSNRTLEAELDSLVAAEKAFAQLSLAKGTRDAFIANLNDDSILFRPDAVAGKAWTEKSPPSTAQLSWDPAFADIAAAGDLGYTTGPWEIRRTPQDAPSDSGHYVTVWRKQPDGSWKIAIDIGISHTAAAKPARVAFPEITRVIPQRSSENQIQIARVTLLDAERKFATTTEGYLNQLATEARLYRNHSLPFVGQAAVRAELAKTKGTFTWKLGGTGLAASADLGYAYGSAEFRPAGSSKPVERSNYLRIWKRQSNGQWKVVLDLVG